MRIIKSTMNYFDEAVDIAFEGYISECRYVEAIGSCSRDEISKVMSSAFQNQNGILCLENEKVVGYLLFSKMWNNNKIFWLKIPIWGCGAVGAGRVKIISMLFQRLAEEQCINKRVHFEINLYAHDYEIIRLFSFLQFGIQCEEGITYVNGDIPCSTIANIKELTKKEINEKWNEIWKH